MGLLACLLLWRLPKIRKLVDAALLQGNSGAGITGLIPQAGTTIRHGRFVTDGVIATDTSLVSATAAFTSADVGSTVTGAGISAATTIVSRTNATTVVLSQATTATATGVTVNIAVPELIYDHFVDALTASQDAYADPKFWIINSQTIGVLRKLKDTLRPIAGASSSGRTRHNGARRQALRPPGLYHELVPEWMEIGHGVFVRRHRSFDVNCGLVVGDDEALLIDTRSWRSEAEELRDSIRDVTLLPVRKVVNTHGHFDHCFGNEVFAGASTIWGQKGCVTELLDYGEMQRSVMVEHLPEHARDLLAVQITPPTALVDHEACVDVGGRSVRLVHHGRGHTDHDLIVSIDGGEVVFAGDLIEQSGPPSFEDAWPAEWPATVARLIDEGRSLFVPGHGTTLSREAVTQKQDELRALAGLLTDLAQGEIDERTLMLRSPFPETTTRTAVRRTQETVGPATRG